MITRNCQRLDLLRHSIYFIRHDNILRRLESLLLALRRHRRHLINELVVDFMDRCQLQFVGFLHCGHCGFLGIPSATSVMARARRLHPFFDFFDV